MTLIVLPTEPKKKGAPKRKRRKYHNVPCEVDGNRFDSKGEAEVYGELKILQRAGEIANLEWRKAKLRLPIIVNGFKITSYTPDFRYYDVKKGKTVYLDVKSPATAQDRYYQLRVKLVLAIHGIRITERVIGKSRKPKATAGSARVARRKSVDPRSSDGEGRRVRSRV